MANFSVGQYLALGGDPSYEVIQITGVYPSAYIPYYTYLEISNNGSTGAVVGTTYTGAIDVIDQDYSIYTTSGGGGGALPAGCLLSLLLMPLVIFKSLMTIIMH